MSRKVPPQTNEWIVEQARNGHPPETLLKPLVDNGWAEDDAIEAVEQAMRGFLDAHARDSGLPPSVPVPRSEEHTSELQSLMRISYAVFCLKKKKKRKHTHTITVKSRKTTTNENND